MNFKEYQEQSKETAVYPIITHRVIYPSLGLVSEAGEVAGVIKKIFRDKEGIFSEEDLANIKKELGDVLWYISQVATDLNLNLEEIAKANIKKLQSRKARGVLGGSGDNR